MTGETASPFCDVQWRSNCPLSSALDVIGDKWSLLILRDLLVAGDRTYSDFLGSAEGISTNILADRLSRLHRYNLVQRDTSNGHRNAPYQLTPAGAALEPVLRALVEWAANELSGDHPTMLGLNDVQAGTAD